VLKCGEINAFCWFSNPIKVSAEEALGCFPNPNKPSATLDDKAEAIKPVSGSNLSEK